MANPAGIAQDMTTGNLPRKLLLFSLPLMLANLLQQIYNLVDVLVVGQFMDSAGVSGVSNGADIQLVVSMLAFSSCHAGQVVIAQYLGKGDRDSVRNTIGTMFCFMTLLSIVIMLIGFLCAEWMLRAVNVPDEAFFYARQYSLVCSAGSFFIFGYNMISAILRGLGDSRHPLVFVAVAASVNLLLDLLFVAVLGFGTWGAALATVIGQGVSFLSSLVFLYRRREAFGFDFSRGSFRIHPHILAAICRLAVPMALQACAVRISKLYLNSYINDYGVTASAVNGIGGKLSCISDVVTGGVSTAATTMVGQNFGAGQKRRVRQAVYLVLITGLAFAALMSAVSILFPAQIFSLFSSDPEVLAMAPVYAWVLVLNFFGFALRGTMHALLNGIGNAPLSMACGILDGVVARIGFGLLFGVSLGWGIRGFWYGDAFAGYIPFLIGGVYFWSGLWEKRKLVVT